jgi:phage-related baseplate assembly protein
VLNLQTFVAWVQQQAAAAQGACATVLDFTVGSVLRVLIEANSAVALWMQWLILLVLQQTRAATSNGADLDTWMADFFFTRLPAVSATGSVMLSTATLGLGAFVPVGAQVKTTDGTQTFAVTVDTSNSAYSATLGGYSMAPGATSITVPVQALTPGVGGNVQAGGIGLLATSISGLTNATNPVAFTNGIDAESDASFRARFQLYMGGLRSAIPAAIEEAADTVQQGVRYQLVQNSPQVGFYTLYVDDGSGNPPDSFITAITSAVQAVTAEGVTPVVRRFTLLPVTVSVNLKVTPNANRQTVVANASTALASYVATLAILPTGMTLPYLELPVVIAGSDASAPGISPGSLVVNGATSDINAPVGSLITASSVTVS